MNRLVIPFAILLGVAFLGLAALYWLVPAGSLPAFIPGFEADSSHIHFKHGLASFILAVGLFVFAWFKSAPSKAVSK
jgi:hypothetical protein